MRAAAGARAVRRRPRAAPALLVAIAAACAPEPLALVSHDFGGAAGAKLDQPLVLSFNDRVDPGSVRGATVRVLRERDGAEVAGTLTVREGDVIFAPRLPEKSDLSDAGLQPDERYRVEVPGLPMLRCVRGLGRGPLERGATLSFATIRLEGVTLADAPAERLFVDPVPGSPELVPRTRDPRPMTRDGKVTLCFSEPLDPRGLDRARFVLTGPWSQTAEKDEDPPMDARLLENQREAVVQLALSEPAPSPLSPDEQEYWLEIVHPERLVDLAGQSFITRFPKVGPVTTIPVRVER